MPHLDTFHLQGQWIEYLISDEMNGDHSEKNRWLIEDLLSQIPHEITSITPLVNKEDSLSDGTNHRGVWLIETAGNSPSFVMRLGNRHESRARMRAEWDIVKRSP